MLDWFDRKRRTKNCQLITSFIDVVAVVVRNWTKAIIIVAIHEKNNRTSTFSIQHSYNISKWMFIQISSNRVFVSDVFFLFLCAIFTSVLKFQKIKFQLNLLWQRDWRRWRKKDDKLNGKQEEQQQPTTINKYKEWNLFRYIFIHRFGLFGLLKWVEDSLHVNNNHNKYGKRR